VKKTLQISLACLFFITSTPAIYPVEQDIQPDSTITPTPIELVVQWTDKKLTIDGVLDDDAWNDATPYEDYFYQLQPLDRAPSSEKTRVMVLQDAKMLYFGIQCYDSEPEKIYASAMRRDNNYGSGEVLELLLDTFRDNRNCYAFDTNPLGGKGDAIIHDQGNHVNKQWECVIYMDGQRNQQGWAAEFAIPFKSIKYKQGEVVDWGINITREIKHRQEETYLVPLPRALGHTVKFRGEMFATLSNIHPPKQGFNFEMYPYLLAGRTNVYGDKEKQKNDLNAGIDFKYDVSPQLALDLTYNTDFAQAEAEEEIVNVTRFNIQRQEKREFFLQNAGYFQFGPGQRTQSDFSLFDSRTIGIYEGQRTPLHGGGKLTGRAGRYSIAALNLQSKDTNLEGGGKHLSTNYTALRLKRDLGKNSHIGMMALNQQTTSADYSRAFGVDGLWNINPVIRLDASLARSISPDVKNRDMAGDFGFILNKEWLDVNLRYTHIDSLFNPRMGFVQRPNIRKSDGDVTFTNWLNRAYLQNIAISTGLTYITDHRQALQTRDNTFSVSALTQHGDQLAIGATRSYEFVPEQAYIRSIAIDPGQYTTWYQSISLGTYRARPVYVNTSYVRGDLFDGKQQSAMVSGTAKITNHLMVDVAYTWNQLQLQNGALDANVLSTRWTNSFTPDLFTKAYLQWNSADERLSANFLLDYAYKPRSHIYLVYNENHDTLLNEPRDRMVMLKMTWLGQI